jgi:DNA invertase Pin-like site-specific DNA recombinase
MPHADNFTIGILAMLAQKEREMISARTKDALAAANARGAKLGKPENLRNQMAGRANGRAARMKAAINRASDIHAHLSLLRTQRVCAIRDVI